jgi:HK97 family phage prohead protease
MQNLSWRFEIKADDKDKGTFVAYGNVFGVVDSADDISIEGCFEETIKAHKAAGTMPRLLAQHGHTMMPIGIITDMIEDEKGLRFEGKFAETTQAGQEAADLVRMGAIDTFSIGYVVTQHEYRMINGVRVRAMLEVDVKEISLVTFACNTESKIESIKSAVMQGESVTPRMVQKALQEGGLSKRQAESAINQIKIQEETQMSVKGETQVEKTAPETKSTPMEVKGGWYMEHTLENPILSVSCVHEVLSYLPPASMQKIIDAAEEGRLIQLAAFAANRDADEEKSETGADVEVKADAEVKSTEILRAELKAELLAEIKAEAEEAEKKVADEDESGTEKKVEDEDEAGTEKKVDDEDEDEDETKSATLNLEEMKAWFKE